MNLQAVNLPSIILRLFLATIFGGIIGYERESAKKPAGLRTHMLICIGSALVMLTGQYTFQFLSPSVDPTRIGAQVISGIGFLGVGTIVIIGRRQVQGLTTAAGLWASACMGLAIGIGFYSGAIVGGLLIFIVETLLQNLDTFIVKRSRFLNLYVEVEDKAKVTEIQNFFISQNATIEKINMSREQTISPSAIGLILQIKLADKKESLDFLTDLMKVDWIKFVQEG